MHNKTVVRVRLYKNVALARHAIILKCAYKAIRERTYMVCLFAH